MSENSVNPKGTKWSEYRETIFSKEEIEECNSKVAIIGEIIKARKQNGLTQKELELKSGFKQPIIAKLEKGTTDPQLSTVTKLLASLDKTLAVVPLEKKVH